MQAVKVHLSQDGRHAVSVKVAYHEAKDSAPIAAPPCPVCADGTVGDAHSQGRSLLLVQSSWPRHSFCPAACTSSTNVVMSPQAHE